MTFDERYRRLQSQWGFKCSCSVCNASRDAINVSDTRLKQMQLLEEQLADISPRRNASTDFAEKLISLYKEENIHGPIAKAYEYAALEYSYAEQKTTARKYAEMATEVGKLWRGPFDSNVKNMESLLNSPEKHPSWGLYKN